jgi:hypothetical protein
VYGGARVYDEFKWNKCNILLYIFNI